MTNLSIKIEVINIDDSDSEQTTEPKVTETQISGLMTQESRLLVPHNTQIEQKSTMPSTSCGSSNDEINYLLDRCKYYHNKLLAYEPVMHGFQIDRWLEHLRALRGASSYLENPTRPQTAWEIERANHPLPSLSTAHNHPTRKVETKVAANQKNNATASKPVNKTKKSPKKVRKVPKKGTKRTPKKTVKKASKRAPKSTPAGQSSSSTKQTDAFLRAKQAAKAMRDRIAKAKALYQNSVKSGRRPPPGSTNPSTPIVKKDVSSSFRVKTEKPAPVHIKTEKPSNIRIKNER